MSQTGIRFGLMSSAEALALALDTGKRLFFFNSDYDGQPYYRTGGTLVALPSTVHASLSGLGADDHTQYQLRSEKNANSGYLGLDSGGLVPNAKLQTALGVFAGLNPNANDFIQWVSGAWANRSVAQVTAALSLATTTTQGMMAAADKKKMTLPRFYAVADLGLDNTGASNMTTTLQTWLTNTAPAAFVLYFEPGDYWIDGVTCSNKLGIFLGENNAAGPVGYSITRMVTHAATGDVITFSGTNAQGSGVERIRFQAATANSRTAGYAINLGSVPNTYVYRCDVIWHWSGIYSGGVLQNIQEVSVREFSANANNGVAILVAAYGDRYITRLTTDNGSPANPTGSAGIRVLECASLVISDSNIIHSGNAIDLVPNAGGGHAVASVKAVNCFFDSSVIGCNILPASSLDTVNRAIFMNCWFGTHTVAGVNLGNGTIPNANITGIDFIGCEMYQAPYGVRSQGATEWSVRACRIAGCTTNGIKVSQGGQTDQAFVIADCTIGNVANMGANAQGITIDSGTYKRYQITDNRGLESNTTPGMSDAGVVASTGQKMVLNNMGALVQGVLQPLASGGGSLADPRGMVTVTVGTQYFMTTVRVPANSVVVGQTFRIVGWFQSNSTGTLAWQARIGALGTTGDAAMFTATSAATTANGYVKIEGYVRVIALGASNTVVANGGGQTLAAAFNQAAAAEVISSVPTTADWFISVTVAASAGVHTCKQLVIEAL